MNQHQNANHEIYIFYHLVKLNFQTKLLEENHNLRIIELDEPRAKYLSEKLNHTLVLQGNASDEDLLKEEGIENTDLFLLGLQVMRESLTWIVVGALSFALSLMVLRVRKGKFTGRTILIIAFGGVLWTMSSAALDVAIRIVGGEGYEYDVSTVMADWGETMLAIFIFWAVRTAVRSWSTRQETARYWGV